MKSRCENWSGERLSSFSRVCLNENESINQAIWRVKNSLRREHSGTVKSNARLLELALQEAEALAWQTEFPHLLFPVLAAEKAQAVVAWHQRQTQLKGQGEIAFAV